MNKTITVVIPNYNGVNLLSKNLPSVLKALKNYDQESSVIVVDDGSEDASVRLLAEKFTQVKVLVHAVNRGFAEAVHTGVKEATTDLVFIL